MSMATDLAAAVAAAQADAAKLHAIVNGPAAGGTSLVTLADGVTVVKTLARVAAESAALFVANSVAETVAAAPIVAGAVVFDLTVAGIFTVDLIANITGVTISGAVAGKAASFLVILTAKGPPRTMAQPGSVDPATGAYAPSSANGKRDRLMYDTVDGGATWTMSILRQNY